MSGRSKRISGVRWMAMALGAGAVVAVGVWALQPRPVVVDVAPVREGRFELVVEEDGRLRPVQRMTVAAPVQGRVVSLRREVGDRVQAGELLAEVAPSTPALLDARTLAVLRQRVGAAEAALSAALAQQQRAQVTWEQARAQSERTLALAQQRFVAPAALEQAQRAEREAAQALAAAEAEHRRAGFALAEARAALAQSDGGEGPPVWPVRSPVTGHVLKRHLDSALPVGVGQPLFDVADLTQIEAVVEVLSADALRLTVGAPATLSPGPGLPPLPARVVRIEPRALTKVSALGVEEQRVPVVLRLEDGAGDPTVRATLGDGFRVEARVVVAAQERVLLVPGGALVRDGEAWRVLVVRDGRAEARRVVVRQRNPDEAWVEQGVAVGDWVVLYPGERVGDGLRVQARTTERPR